MFIVPLNSSITPLDTMSQNIQPAAQETDHPSFADVFTEVIGEVQATQADLDLKAAQVVMGDIDDLHSIYNSITKAEISLQTMVAIRDAGLQSYREIMQMTV